MTGLWLWCAFMFFFVLSPVGYGWGYRGWGAPYPRHIQRRRGDAASASGVAPAFDHHAWGRGGDMVWVGLFIALCWAAAILWRH